ncbi:MAG TPA: hypothetical protein VEC35_12890 [Noviherbaspirillum sp.]|nr:hypothetical protein [Noviherbaspirillum sp.]
MKIICCIMFSMVLLTIEAFAAPRRGPAVEAGGDTVTISLPEIEIEGTYTGRGPSKVPRGEDSGNSPGAKPSTPKVPPAAPLPPQGSIEAKAQKELEDAANELRIKLGDPPLESTSLLLDHLFDKLWDLTGPIGELYDALAPEPIGLSPLDKAKNKDEMRALKHLMEQEERDLSEKNRKALEENEKKLIPEQLRFEKAIVGIASLKSDDFKYVTAYTLVRSRRGTPVPIGDDMKSQIVKVLSSAAPANACEIQNGSVCMLFGIAQGKSCYCPRFRPDRTWVPVLGKAVKRPLGKYCRSGQAFEKLVVAVPEGATCGIPVNISNNPYMPVYEYLRGKVAESPCDPYNLNFDPECD